MFCISLEVALNLFTLVACLLLLVKHTGLALTRSFTSCRLVREETCSDIRRWTNSAEVFGLVENEVTSTRSPSASASNSGSDRDGDTDYDCDDAAESVTLVLPGDLGKTTPSATASLVGGTDFINTYQSLTHSPCPPRTCSQSSCVSTPLCLSSALSQSQRCERQITSVLNKMTRERFENLYQQLLNVCCCEEAGPDIIHVIAREVFAKATTQYTLAEMYADVCSRLYNDLSTAQSRTPEAAYDFKRHLLGQCQNSFHAYLQPPNIDASLDEEEQYEHFTKYKTKMLGNMRLMAHLIRRKYLSPQVIFDCTGELLTICSAETLESLCTFVSTLGDFFDAPKWHGNVKLLELYSHMALLAEDVSQTPRIRFLIKNVLDERKARLNQPSTCAVESSQVIATPISHGPVLLARTRFAQGREAGTQESDSKKQACDRKQERQEKKTEQVREKPEPLERRKRNRRRCKVKTEGAIESDVMSTRAEPKTAHSTTKSSSKLAFRHRDGDRKSICRFFVGIDDDRDFQVCRRLIGPGGENMKRITSEAAEAKIRIRGFGSKYLEGPNNEESSDPLMICVSATSRVHFEQAVSQVEALLEKVHEEYRGFCRSKGLRAPALSIHRENVRADANA